MSYRSKWSMAAMTAATTLLAAACQSGSSAGDAHLLESAHWRLAELAGRKAITDSTAREAFIEFDTAKGSVAGSSGCNRFGGGYQRNGDALAITQIISTKMACLAEGAMAQEAAFFAALERTRHWKIAGDRLDLYDSTGAAVARFDRGDR